MNSQTIHIAIYTVIAFWYVFVAWRLYLGFNLKSFLLIALSILLLLISIPVSPILHKILGIVSELLFGIGVILMGTLELNKLKEIWMTISIKDCLLGRIPSERIYKDVTLSRIEKVSFILLSMLLIMIPIIDYYIFERALRETWPLLIFGTIFIVYFFFAGNRE